MKKIDEGLTAYDALWEEADASQRDRLEETLKKELKKLQREREKVKSWAAKGEVRDKAFKELERESKTKAFSKAGLARGEAETPEERERREESEWLQDRIRTLEQEAEELEAEMEILVDSRRRESSEAVYVMRCQQPCAALHTRRAAWSHRELAAKLGNHRFHIENLNKLIRLLANEVLEPDELSTLHDDLECYMDMWREQEASMADLYMYEDFVEMGVGDTDAAEREMEKALEKVGGTDSTPTPDTPTEEEEDTPAAAAAGAAPTPAPASRSGGVPAAAAGGSGGSTGSSSSRPARGDGGSSSRAGVTKNKWAAGAPSSVTGSPSRASAAPEPRPTQAPADTPASGAASTGGAASGMILDNPRMQHDASALALQLKLLTHSLSTVPEGDDLLRPPLYTPASPARGHPSFPLNPAPQLGKASAFEKFDLDTLFFIFYYQQGTQAQYLAAAQLKKRSWRFHKAYRTWLKRHSEGMVRSEHYEKGTFTFFDYEKSWKSKVKQGFKFEFSFMEDELPPQA
ncbi:NOT5 [Symbiodinium sp. KB8]|nr:NOT5 [Symbiodinium sp. KB8]